MPATPMTYSVEAYNLSHASENKIHDDTVAKKLGFTGGLVPGVEMYAYMTHPVLAAFGRDWLSRGRMDCRLLKPLYDGRTALITAAPTAPAPGLELKLESDGVLCATGHASMAETGEHAPSISDWQLREPPSERPPASPASLSVDTWLSTAAMTFTPDQAATYLRDVREENPLYGEHGLAHPGILLRLLNSALKENVVLAPWVHTGSKVRNYAEARIGDKLQARARVTANYERKGHRLVELDGIVVANGAKLIARVQHTAVYALRQLAETH